jgi:hypothetical protein
MVKASTMALSTFVCRMPRESAGFARKSDAAASVVLFSL